MMNLRLGRNTILIKWLKPRNFLWMNIGNRRRRIKMLIKKLILLGSVLLIDKNKLIRIMSWLH